MPVKQESVLLSVIFLDHFNSQRQKMLILFSAHRPFLFFISSYFIHLESFFYAISFISAPSVLAAFAETSNMLKNVCLPHSYINCDSETENERINQGSSSS